MMTIGHEMTMYKATLDNDSTSSKVKIGSCQSRLLSGADADAQGTVGFDEGAQAKTSLED